MPRRVEFEGKVHEFPDDASDDEIRGVLEGGSSARPSAPKPPEYSLSGFSRNVVESGGNFLKGIGNALAHPLDTAASMVSVFSPTAMTVGPGGVSLGPTEQKQAAAQHYQQRLAHPIETAYKDPVGTLADVSMVAGGAGAVGRVANMPRFANAANAVANLTNPLTLPAKAVGAASKAVLPSPERMYQSALKPPTGTDMRDVQGLVRVGLEDAIPVSGRGLEKARGNIDAINQQAAATIAKGAAQGKTVDPMAVAGRTGRSLQRFSNQVNNRADIGAINDSTREFLQTQGGAGYDATGTMVVPPKPMPVDKAQAVKQGTYAKLRDSYGELSTAAKEAQKDLARGLKEEIYSQFPELRSLGLKEKSLIDLEGALERYVNRHGNRDLVGIGTPISAGAAHAITGSTGVAAGAAFLKAALDHPPIKSRLAIALKRAQSIKSPTRTNAALTAAERTNESQSDADIQ